MKPDKRSMHCILLAVVMLAGGATDALASTGYHPDYDYPGRGDDWYGRLLPDTRRDFPATPVDEASDGDDFGIGYEILVDPVGFGPPLALTNGSPYEYRFRFGSRLADPQECYVDDNCADGVFCNGEEVCYTGECRDGADPDCDDSDACTSDSCDKSLDRCVHDPLQNPGEIQGLLVDKPVPAEPVANLSWNGAAAADHYNLYRGEAVDLSDMTCFMTDIFGTSADDDGAIPAVLFEYLVTGFGCGGESTLGTDSDSVVRTPSEWCP
jgi:hypothetical protein